MHISRFEASELLPRAIRNTVDKLFNGAISIDLVGLREAWTFIYQMVAASRTYILSPEFWKDVGRFPLPICAELVHDLLHPEALAPAFLTYWPDSMLVSNNALFGIPGLRRVHVVFLKDLATESGISLEEWKTFFEKAGVSQAPKILNYARVVGREHGGIPLDFHLRSQSEKVRFTGERQVDANSAVVTILQNDRLWQEVVRAIPQCGHSADKFLQSVSVIESLLMVTRAAEEEFHNGDERWQTRLWDLVQRLPLPSQERDSIFCGSGRTGHPIPLAQYLDGQLDHYRWLPSTLGPGSRLECFVRSSSRRVISSGAANEELGDQLLPYVVVEGLPDLARLQQFGVQIFDDVGSADSATLMRVLAILGEKLSTEWGREGILNVRSRWRLVRGAIQEMYRVLNQREKTLNVRQGTKFAARTARDVEFRESPFFYAEPGSAIEQAFKGVLALFDADRPYPQLFNSIGVKRLIAGQTVEESLLSEAASTPAETLQDEIVHGLTPYLLAPLIARSDKVKREDAALIIRKLQERFNVRAATQLRVRFRLNEEPYMEQIRDCPKFYLQIRLVQGQGAIKEEHYTLYLTGDDSVTLFSASLDGDALGDVLVPLFTDRVSDELAGLFPRIVSRYQQLRGEQGAMRDFMYFQLGISEEALEAAQAFASGEILDRQSVSTPPPPPATILRSPFPLTTQRDSSGFEENIRQHTEKVSEKATRFFQELADTTTKSSLQTKGSEEGQQGSSVPPKVPRITPEQQARGRRGEEEMKRRLQRPDGWEGFRYLQDRRADNCGFDFLCVLGAREVKLEVKTFTAAGRVIVTSGELQEAAVAQEDYFLIGVLDDGKPEHQWSTFVLPNPIDTLLSKGEFDVKTELQASAQEIFHTWRQRSTSGRYS